MAASALGGAEPGPAREAAPERSARPAAAAELGRPELEAAIARLSAALASPAGGSPRDARLELLVRGRGALEAAPAALAAALAPLLAQPPSATSAATAAFPGASPAPRGPEREAPELACATLALLLEAGTPLDRELELPPRPAPIRELLPLALGQLGAGPAAVEPCALDLLAFSVLSGEEARRDQLARAAHAGLTRLELDRRAPDAAGDARASDFLLDAAVFRAVAVLAQPDLEQRARRHLNALLQDERRGREARRRALGEAADEAARHRRRLADAESLGQLEVALFGAHVALRRPEGPGPAPALASSMRHVASELVAHAQPLAAALADAASSERELRSAAHALRGLRAARVAL